MTSDFNFQKAREAWGDKVVAPTHHVFQEWLNNPLTKALKQSHKNEIEKLEARLAEAIWNYGELKRKEWVGLTDDDYEELLTTRDWGVCLIEAVEAKLKEKNT